MISSTPTPSPSTPSSTCLTCEVSLEETTQGDAGLTYDANLVNANLILIKLSRTVTMYNRYSLPIIPL